MTNEEALKITKDAIMHGRMFSDMESYAYLGTVYAALEKMIEAERQSYSFTVNLDDNQIEAWKDIIYGGKDNRAACELAEKTINEVWPRYQIALAKQIPMEPVNIGHCPSCGAELDVWNYCPVCGQALKWGTRE